MKWKLVLGAALAGALCAPCPLMAATTVMTDKDAEVLHDAQCIVLSEAHGPFPLPPEFQEFRRVTNAYFMGKIFGAAPTADLQAELRRAKGTITAANSSNLALECSYDIANTRQKFIDASKAIQAETAAAPK